MFVGDFRNVDTAEREFQVAIQAALDIGSILLADVEGDVPEVYREVFPHMADAGILPRAFGDRLADMASFRNVLVHMYLKVDPRLVYDLMQTGLPDLAEFARHVGQYLEHLRHESE